MKRRTVLTTATACLGVGLAGCLGGGGDAAGDTTEGTDGTDSTEARTDDDAAGAPTSTDGEGDPSLETTVDATDDDRVTTDIDTGTGVETGTGTAATTDGTGDAPAIDRTFTVRGRDGQPGNEAQVAFENGGTRVVVTGTITGKDGCQTAVLDSIRLDDSTLTVTVGTESEAGAGAGAVCSQALVGIDYRLVATLERPPVSVGVVHRGATDSGEVTSAEPSG